MKLEIVNSNDTSKEDVLQLRLIYEDGSVKLQSCLNDGSWCYEATIFCSTNGYVVTNGNIGWKVN